MGIGHELCGDDAVGMQVAAMVRAAVGNNPQLLVIEAGPAPENFTGVLRRFQPDLIYLVDAALFGALPGGVRCLPLEKAEGMSASTHTLPLNLLASYLTMELGCELELIGIQPGNTFTDAPLTPPVMQAAHVVVEELVNLVKNQTGSLIGI
jgi:hydrogenase 3 maturation protease